MRVYLPAYVLIPRKTKKDKKFWVDLNTYRNTHYRILNEAKQIYNEIVKDQILTLPKATSFPIRIKYVFNKLPTKKEMKEKKITLEDFKKSEGFAPFKGELEGKSNWDIGNMVVHGKFFEDALVEFGIIPNDNVSYLKTVVYDYGGCLSNDIYAEILY